MTSRRITSRWQSAHSSSNPLLHRIRAVRRAFTSSRIQALLVTHPLNVRYLLGIQDLRWGLVTPYRVAVMPFTLSWELIRREVGRRWNVLEPDVSFNSLMKLLKRDRITRLGVESLTMSVSAHEKLTVGLKGIALLVPAGGVVEAARERKDSVELDALRLAGRIAAEVAQQLPWLLKPGMTEREAAERIDRRMLIAGASAPAFETIVLFGERTALPHGSPSGRRIVRGELCLVDFGARVDGYHSDMTRVFALGKATARQRAMYDAVWRAYDAARRGLRPGSQARTPDRLARTALGSSLVSRFIHSLGHGVGLEVHEGPRLAAGEKTRLRAGHVITVEPGVYFPRWGGVRLEDTYQITPAGRRSLTGEPARVLPVI